MLSLPRGFAIDVPVWAQDATLADGAEKAGSKVIAYGPLESETVEAIVKIFTLRTGIKVGILAGLGGQMRSIRRLFLASERESLLGGLFRALISRRVCFETLRAN